MTKAVLGVIGGSGIYDLPGLEKVRQRTIRSPWGEPSAPPRIGEIAVRTALGASRARVVIQLFAEALHWTSRGRHRSGGRTPAAGIAPRR